MKKLIIFALFILITITLKAQTPVKLDYPTSSKGDLYCPTYRLNVCFPTKAIDYKIIVVTKNGWITFQKDVTKDRTVDLSEFMSLFKNSEFWENISNGIFRIYMVPRDWTEKGIEGYVKPFPSLSKYSKDKNLVVKM